MSRRRSFTWYWVFGGGAALLIAVATIFYLQRADEQSTGLPLNVPGHQMPPAFQSAWEEAAERARTALSPDTVADLARLAHANGFDERATVYWQWLRQAQPAEARWPYYEADLLRSAGRDAEAIEHLRTVVKLNPDYALAWLKIGDYEFKSGALAEAEDAYRRRLARVVDDSYARLGLARLAEQRGDTATARRDLEALVSDAPDFSPAQNLLAVLMARAGEPELAARHRWLATTGARFREADDPWVKELEPWCFLPKRLAHLGAVRVQSREWAEAERLFRRAIELDPRDTEAIELLGRLLMERNRPQEAEAVLSAGVRLPEATDTMWVDLSAACRAQSRHQEALDVALKGLVALPQSATLHTALGQAHAALGQLDAAETSFRTALERDPRVTDPALNLAVLALRSGRTADAMASLQEALRRQPLHPRAVVMLSNLEMDQGSLEAAGPRLRRLFEAYPGDRDARQALARWYLQGSVIAAQSGQVELAITRATEGTQVVPEAPALRGFLGYIYAEQQRFDEAIRELEMARRGQPDEIRVVVTLVQIYVQRQQLPDARRAVEEARDYAQQRGNPELAGQFTEFLQQLLE